MNKKLAFGFAALCATSAFVACGDGSIVSTDNTDKLAKASAQTDLLELDANDIKNYMDLAGIPTDENTFSSATSSAADPSSSAGNTTPGGNTPGGTTPGGTIPGGTTPVNPVIVSSSSITVLISSSSVAPVNPGSTENAGAFGTCAAATIKKGGTATWSFKNNSASFGPADVQAATFEWVFEGSSVPTFSGAGISGMTVPGAAYAESGSYVASVTVTKADGTSATIACDPIQVDGAEISGCECTAGAAPDVAEGESATWTVSGCTSLGKSGTGYAFTDADYVWSGTGVTGAGATATGAVAKKGDVVEATVSISNDDKTKVELTCPAVTAKDNREPDYKLNFEGTQIPQTGIAVKNDGCVVVNGTWTAEGYNPKLSVVCKVDCADMDGKFCYQTTDAVSISVGSEDAVTGQYSASASALLTNSLSGSIENKSVCVHFSGMVKGDEATCSLSTN